MRVSRFLFSLFVVIAVAAPAAAQMSMPSPPLAIGEARDGSGTSWLPDNTPLAGTMKHGKTWMLMAHWNLFGQFIKTTGLNGDQQAGSINWGMGMASRDLAGGLFTVRSMVSAEPLTARKCGYPDLRKTGESCNGIELVDRQHPHDMVMELAADYRRELTNSVAFEFYGGPAGEPALGPVAFPHRASAMPNPIAPISHHWLDATHISFGVATAGVYGRKWKAEGSIFNGREPDDNRYDFDFGALDSYSGRLWLMPTRDIAVQVSAGHLTEAEHGDDVIRFTASAMFHRSVAGGLWATTVAWGANREHGDTAPAFLIETALDVTKRQQVFARFERVDKSPLATKWQAGFTQWLPVSGVRAGIGGSVAVSPDPARGEYTVFLTLRPR
jgi:hypothetical protein